MIILLQLLSSWLKIQVLLMLPFTENVQYFDWQMSASGLMRPEVDWMLVPVTWSTNKVDRIM